MSRTECVSGKKNLQLLNSYPIALDGFRKALEKIQIQGESVLVYYMS